MERKHADIFTAAEAAEYLHLDHERGLETLRTKYGLRGHQVVNKSYMYWRSDLDAVALKMFGLDRSEWLVQNGQLKIAGNRA